MAKDYHNTRIERFMNDRFGMFIHFGLYSIPARGEWLLSNERMGYDEYDRFFREFNPVDFDADEIAKAAKDAGMKYAVLTAKHHDGFCLFDTATTKYNIMNTPFGRDIVREFTEAFTRLGIKVGLYYSLIDWRHEDFPHYGDRHHPMRDNPACKNDCRDFNRYLEFMHAQVRELIYNYGHLDIMWFDFSYDDMTGEKWRASELVSMVRERFPDIIIDNRLEASGSGFGSLVTGNKSPYAGDFVSPEQIIPHDGIRDIYGNHVPWEACVTLNNHWGYAQADNNYKSPELIVKKLVECVSKGGNLLLNVSPNARGALNDQTQLILKSVGAWMRRNGESIYGCGASFIPAIENGRVTRRDNVLYYHIMEGAINDIPLFNLKKEDIESVRLLSTGAELNISASWITDNYPDVVFVRLSDDPNLPETDTVIKVVLKNKRQVT